MERMRILVTMTGSLDKYFQGERTREVSMPAKASAGDLLQKLSVPRQFISRRKWR